MSRDYAHQPKTAAPRSRIPKWVWLFSLSMAALFGYFLYFLANLTVDDSKPTLNEMVEQVKNQGITPTTTQPKQDVIVDLPKEVKKAQTLLETVKEIQDQTVDFDFDDLLTNQTVELSEEDKEEIKQQAIKELNNAWLLQVASFKNKIDADKVRADLILSSLTTTYVESVSVKGQPYYRVMVGPFTEGKQRRIAQNTLIEKGYRPIVKDISKK